MARQAQPPRRAIKARNDRFQTRAQCRLSSQGEATADNKSAASKTNEYGTRAPQNPLTPTRPPSPLPLLSILLHSYQLICIPQPTPPKLHTRNDVLLRTLHHRQRQARAGLKGFTMSPCQWHLIADSIIEVRVLFNVVRVCQHLVLRVQHPHRLGERAGRHVGG